MSDLVSPSNYRPYFYTAEVTLTGGSHVRRVNGYLSILPPPNIPLEDIYIWGEEVAAIIARLVVEERKHVYITLLQPHT